MTFEDKIEWVKASFMEDCVGKNHADDWRMVLTFPREKDPSQTVQMCFTARNMISGGSLWGKRPYLYVVATLFSKDYFNPCEYFYLNWKKDVEKRKDMGAMAEDIRESLGFLEAEESRLLSLGFLPAYEGDGEERCPIRDLFREYVMPLTVRDMECRLRLSRQSFVTTLGSYDEMNPTKAMIDCRKPTKNWTVESWISLELRDENHGKSLIGCLEKVFDQPFMPRGPLKEGAPLQGLKAAELFAAMPENLRAFFTEERR